MRSQRITLNERRKSGIHRFSFLGVVALFFLLQFVMNCKPEKQLSPQAEEGKSIYMANCIACHNVNPKIDGAVGPSVANSSFALLEARMKGEYPPGYTPKRPSAAMTRFNFNESQLKSLEEFLK
ncbi:cytochrome c [Leptospira langatensis]|uniref:Cytochrome c n=1 Tax=Leptospira langatensis TaxID=2484983 RepID=A0A5F1ZUF1_9LEPT|nr:cytochrome c [Leptospira langatensis]TGK03129.1 cytochrome c [Leptospira langatensis]TGL41886.1 cytochrome c [Leptospira langatensis]